MALDRLADQVSKERRDMRVFELVLARGPIGIAAIADETGIPEHKVRYSLRMLEDDDFVEPTPQGAVPADDAADKVRQVNEGVDHLVARLRDLADAFD